MGFRDIWPFFSEHGGHDRAHGYRMGALTTDDTQDTSWEQGYWLAVDAAVGDINEVVDGAVDPAGGLHYIAAASSAALIKTNGGTSAAATHDIIVPVFDVYGGAEFWTRNITDTDDTQIGPISGGGSGAMTGVLIGVTADGWVDDTTATMIGHAHGIDINGDFFVITRLLDVNNRDSWLTGAVVDKIVFRRNV